MSASDDFLSLFDEKGRYKSGDGEVGVVFMTQSGLRYPGNFRFKGGLLVGAAMDGYAPWGDPDENPLDGLKFLLHFQDQKPRAVFIERGRISHSFEMPDQASQQAKEEFLKNFRIARNLFAHPKVESDIPALDTSWITDQLVRSALWLTPKAVEGFDAANFPELQADLQAALQNAVQRFKDVASKVPADGPPSKEQFLEAATAFRTIVDVLSPYMPYAEESQKVMRALRKVKFPDWVVNWGHELGTGWDGDPAVWVDVFASGSITRNDFGRFGSDVIPLIREALAEEGVSRWPFIRLRTNPEFKTAQAHGIAR